MQVLPASRLVVPGVGDLFLLGLKRFFCLRRDCKVSYYSVKFDLIVWKGVPAQRLFYLFSVQCRPFISVVRYFLNLFEFLRAGSAQSMPLGAGKIGFDWV